MNSVINCQILQIVLLRAARLGESVRGVSSRIQSSEFRGCVPLLAALNVSPERAGHGAVWPAEVSVSQQGRKAGVPCLLSTPSILPPVQGLLSVPALAEVPVSVLVPPSLLCRRHGGAFFLLGLRSRILAIVAASRRRKFSRSTTDCSLQRLVAPRREPPRHGAKISTRSMERRAAAVDAAWITMLKLSPAFFAVTSFWL